MSRHYDNFARNYQAVRELGNIYSFLYPQVTAIDVSELLRAEFVLAVSAFDCYMHEIVRAGLVDLLFGCRNERGLKCVELPLDFVKIALNISDEHERRQFVDASIKRQLSKDSYQSPKSVEYAMGLIGVKHLWTELSSRMGIAPNQIKETLALIVNRRNKIAHEADYDDYIGGKTEIEKQWVDDSIEFISSFVEKTDLLLMT